MTSVAQNVMRSVEDRVGLPAAAEILGLHRSTVNEMVREGRIPAERDGAHWYIRCGDLLVFKESYQRPRNTPRRRSNSRRLSDTALEIVIRLADWGDATVAELTEVIGVHDGNIRKNLSILRSRGLAEPDGDGHWSLTPTGEKRAWIAPLSV